jgi:hypothetical protein
MRGKQCGGASICEHNRQRSGCKQCKKSKKEALEFLLPPFLPACVTSSNAQDFSMIGALF